MNTLLAIGIACLLTWVFPHLMPLWLVGLLLYAGMDLKS